MSDDFPITIFHNPDCGTSRNTLAMIRAAGYEPTAVEYLKTGWTRAQLEGLLAAMSARPRDILREKGTPAAELDLLDSAVSDDRILDAMIAHPLLVNRPIVVTPKGVKLSRPSEVVLSLLEKQPASFTKEDGEVVTPHAPRYRTSGPRSAYGWAAASGRVAIFIIGVAKHALANGSS